MTSHAVERPLAATLAEVAKLADYSLLASLDADPNATTTGDDHESREVFSGHYVPVKPTPLPEPVYVAHSPTLFAELGFSDELARSPDFMRFFSGDFRAAPAPMRELGWATGYALSIYGREYTSNCPFGTGNGYGDGRAISGLEGNFNGRRWEMQLKGAGPTPYCRGGDGRAVLRSSVREFLAQEHMHALGVPTSRSLCLYVSGSEMVRRPWYAENSDATDPDRWVLDPAAIATRVASSFLRVGQLELFARRARKGEHPRAMQELESFLRHVLDREYRPEISAVADLGDQLVHLARLFAERLSALVAHWLRVGYCQGNFNSDNTSLGGFTLDYGPFGFMELFDPEYQPWTGGGWHFSFLNQPEAAHRNYHMFWLALMSWDGFDSVQRQQLKAIRESFPKLMNDRVAQVFATKLGLPSTDAAGALVQPLLRLMDETRVDYTVFFRELSNLPAHTEPLRASFYPNGKVDERAWEAWLNDWRAALQFDAARTPERVAARMKRANPKFILREWHLVPAYQQAAKGDYSLVRELQAIMTQPYAEQDEATARKYYTLKPTRLFGMGGVSHMSCSS
jgi:uncharacterized protein YdiU (UPF0061 family)